VAIGTLVYLALSFLGGVFIPFYQFPSGLQTIGKVLPSERMADALQIIWTKGEGITNTGWDLPILAAWALAALLIGARRFRWE
jgi:ABC-type multidrug transport system permease subunit